MKAPLYIAYYTAGSPYEGEAAKLRESLRAYDLPYDIVAIDDRGSWQSNTQAKSGFVRRRMEHKDCPLVYIDVDAVVLRRPIIFDVLRADIAAVRHRGGELFSGTVYFSGGPQSIAVVDKWCALCAAYPQTFPAGLLGHFPAGGDAWDQRMLDIALKQTAGADFYELPPEYTYIVGISQREYPDLAPVILHTRGRLRFEDIVNKP